MSNEMVRTGWNGNNCHMEHFESSTVVAYSQPGLTRAHIERLCAKKLEMQMVGDHFTPKPKQIYTRMERDLRDSVKKIQGMCTDDSTYLDILNYCKEVLK